MNTLSLPPSPAPATAEKLAGFDAVRGIAALGVVLFHACIPYLTHPMPGLTWAVADRPSQVVDFAFWWTELFIMPLFLVMAGFLAMKSLQARGPTTLLRHRARRLLKPLLFGIVVILPLDLYCWVLGWVVDGLVAPVKLKSLKFESPLADHLWGLSHLWFLQYLFLYVLVLAATAYLAKRFRPATAAIRGVPPIGKFAILLALGTATLCWSPEVVWGFQHRFEPVPSKWIYSGLSFALGCAIAVDDARLIRLSSGYRRLALPAAFCSLAAVVLGRWQLAGGENLAAHLLLATLSCASSILITCTILGWAAARIERVPPSLAYLSAASFWIYIVHHPILGLVHIDLKLLLPSVSPVVKTLMAFVVTSGLCLATYEVFVRRTALGRWLGFGWELPRQDAELLDAAILPLPGEAAERQRRAA